MYISNPPQADVSVWLHRDSLVELRAELEDQIHGVSGNELVSRIALLEPRGGHFVSRLRVNCRIRRLVRWVLLRTLTKEHWSADECSERQNKIKCGFSRHLVPPV